MQIIPALLHESLKVLEAPQHDHHFEKVMGHRWPAVETTEVCLPLA